MKFQHKLAVYNTITKVAIITILGLFIVIFIDKISTNHLKARLIDKRNRLISHLSEDELKDLLSRQSTFTDYNILKEEYIEIHAIGGKGKINTSPIFSKEIREIEGEEEEYLIIYNNFLFKGKYYQLEIGETLQSLEQLEKTILLFSLVILLISVSFSILADLAFTKFLLTPFYQIIDQKLNKVDDPIHYNYEPANTTTEDFKHLDSSISSLMKKISDQIITEKQFITNVSHELLTPISILRIRLENLLDDDTLSDESLNKISASLKTLNRLKAIINSLLLISKIENNQFSKTDSVSVKTLIDDIFEELEDRLEDKNIRFERNLRHDFHFTGNQALLHTLCMNLINNAIKYNKQDGRIVISDQFTPEGYNLIIQDEGIGMDPDQIEKAFTRFEKLSGNEDSESYGLGLSIVKSIAAFHDINIDITSQTGLGTTVTLLFI